MKVLVLAEGMPKNFNNWYPGFVEKEIFEADSIESVQKLIDSKCAEAGTNKDPNWELYAPIAIDLDNEVNF